LENGDFDTKTVLPTVIARNDGSRFGHVSKERWAGTFRLIMTVMPGIRAVSDGLASCHRDQKLAPLVGGDFVGDELPFEIVNIVG
jgi:hypothetical protein